MESISFLFGFRNVKVKSKIAAIITVDRVLSEPVSLHISPIIYQDSTTQLTLKYNGHSAN